MILTAARLSASPGLVDCLGDGEQSLDDRVALSSLAVHRSWV